MALGSGSVVIRPETPDDHDTIRELVAAAFGSAAEAELVDRIRASPEYAPEMALVAELDGTIVGHVMISGALIRHDDGERQICMLSPLAVVPAHQRADIGSALVRASLAVAEARERQPHPRPRAEFERGSSRQSSRRRRRPSSEST